MTDLDARQCKGSHPYVDMITIQVQFDDVSRVNTRFVMGGRLATAMVVRR